VRGHPPAFGARTNQNPPTRHIPRCCGAGRPRVQRGSIIPRRAFPRQKPTSAERRPHRPELRGVDQPKKGEGGGVCDPRVFCASKNPSFLARWRVRGRPAARGPAGTGSVGDGVGEGALAKVCGPPYYDPKRDSPREEREKKRREGGRVMAHPEGPACSCAPAGRSR
jgi:hypothetical protein